MGRADLDMREKADNLKSDSKIGGTGQHAQREVCCTSRTCGENNLIDEHEGDETHEKRVKNFRAGEEERVDEMEEALGTQ